MSEDRDPLRYFRIEARELVDQLGQGVLDLQGGEPAETVARLLRHAHTLKGAARVVRQAGLAEAAHELEDVLVAFRETDAAVPSHVIADLIRRTDAMSALVSGLQPPPAGREPPLGAPGASGATGSGGGRGGTAADAAASGSATPSGSAPPSDFATASGLAVASGRTGWPDESPAGRGGSAAAPQESSDVDELLEAVDEAHARFAPLRRQLAVVDRARRAADQITEQLRTGLIERPAAAAAGLSAELTTLGRQLTETVEQVERELDDIRGRAERLRLVPAATILAALHRAVYDAASSEGKSVVFEGRGGELRLDPHVLTQAGNALLHVVRNAVSHGVEPQDERVAAGKAPQGRVSVEVRRRGRYAAFQCRDDGRGFDLDAVRAQAQRRGLVADGAAADMRELMRVLMRGGISTNERVTGVSGRGIGLDAVRDVAEQLGGDVSVSTEPGAGTCVELVVPLALVSLSGLVMQAGGVLAALPLDAVRTCLLLPTVEAAAAAAAGALAYEGRVLPFLALERVLPAGGTQSQPNGHGVAVVVGAGQRTVAVGADRLLGTSTLVVRPLPELAPASPVVGGVSIDAEGNPRIVLDPSGLADAAGGPVAAAPPPPAPSAVPDPVLVVDDSLTTRMLERSILESAGYRVELAASAEEALERARHRRYALFLVDVDMPGLSGFDFVERTRADPGQRSVPAILVTSRASADDRRRGLDAGAGAYIVKSEFDQEELLAHIRDLAGPPS